jgi:hypothetical protein
MIAVSLAFAVRTNRRDFRGLSKMLLALKIQYLWIDALCILQGGDKQDWERESASMAEIYSNSYLTIAATAGSNPEMGLFFRRWTRFKDKEGIFEGSQRLPTAFVDLSCHEQAGAFVRPRLHLGHDRFQETDNALKHIDDAPLLSRAWAFQERLLPARTLHFHAEELIWECKSGMNCECRWLKDVVWVTAEEGVKSGFLKTSLAMFSQDGSHPGSLGYEWLDAVTEFSRLQITEPLDRIPALSGLAKSLQGKALGSYLAGIWRKDLARGLLFERIESFDINTEPLLVQMMSSNREHVRSPQARPPPSWSWTSVVFNSPNAISYDCVLKYRLEEDEHFSIQDVQCSPVGNNLFGWATNGLLKVRGRVVQATPRSPQSFSADKLKVEISRSNYSHAVFVNDGRSLLNDQTRLLCFLVGSSKGKTPKGYILQYAIVLRKSEAKPDYYERVGILQVEDNKVWFPKAASVEPSDIKIV